MSQIVVRMPGILSVESGGQAVMLSLEEGHYYGLNDSGTVVWRFLESPRSIGELSDEIQRVYAVDEATAQTDLMTLLDELKKQKLIEIRPVMKNDPAKLS